MDKSWIDLRDKNSRAYVDGIKSFLNFAYINKEPGTFIYCPCNKCANRYYQSRDTVNDHLVLDGFRKCYKVWTKHGEYFGNVNPISNGIDVDNIVDDLHVESSVGANMIGMVHEGRGVPQMEGNIANDEEPEIENVLASDGNLAKFLQLLKDAETKLYPNCEGYTTLSFCVELLHIKVLNGWSNKSFTMLLEFMRKVWPDANIPKSYYEANKITTDLGFIYETWDACPNSCMLFRNDKVSLEKCDICNASRYKDKNNSGSEDGGNEHKKISIKKVRYFPLKPRLQKLFWSSKTAPLMRWHAEKRINDGVQRHPADSQAWKDFDEQNPIFASDCRNVRLGLATDGFNPFGNMSVSHSTWPVVLMPYNLPPWLCMKQPHFIMSLLVDGPKAPGNKIDVFLQPLVEELNELWNEGVSTYDASKKEMFKLHAALLWTINDFPAYGDISGWSTKGEFACPQCNIKPNSLWLKHGRKFCYADHRRFLPRNHRFRKDRVSFIQKKVEVKPKPSLLSGKELLKQLRDIDMETVYKKDDVLKKRRRDDFEKQQERVTKVKKHKTHNWKKKSIFFELPYWEHNLIRHNLDVMHIEKNVCDNVLFTLLGLKGKTKDHFKARKDLQDMNIRPELHPTHRGANQEYLPPAQFTMSKQEKDIFLKVLKDVKVPDGYSSNISRRVQLEERSIGGLKSHDNHILLQQILPIALRKVLPKNVVKALIELGSCFRQLCSKENTLPIIEQLRDRIAVMICTLETIFPPSFFDVMEHLPIHLADELFIAGPVVFRWMYPVERYLQTLKKYVRNRAHPEASIAKGILVEECMTFCARYLDETTETKSNRPIRINDGGDFSGHATRKKKFSLESLTRKQAHRYVLANTEAVQPFMKLHLDELKELYPRDPRQVDRVHHESFEGWFKQHVQSLISTGEQVSNEIKILSMGPKKDAFRSKSYVVNGFRFRTKKVDVCKGTQNSGVMLTAKTMSYASRRDRNPREGVVTYYGQLTDIIEIRYTNSTKFVLFRCDWINNQQGKKEDEFKFTLVNFDYLLYNNNLETDEPFILAGQAEQVWYVQDPMEPDWHVVIPLTARDKFDMYSTENIVQPVAIPQVQPFNVQELDQIPINTSSCVRDEIDGETIDVIEDEDDIFEDEDEIVHSDND